MMNRTGAPVMRGHRGRAALLASSALTIGLAFCAPALAQDREWDGSSSSDWNTGANWDTGTIPTSTTSVDIDTIAPNPTLINGLNATASQMRIGRDATGALTISGGATLTSTNTTLGHNDTGTGTVTVTGAGSSWLLDDNDGGADLIVGRRGTGSVLIANGGSIVVNGAQQRASYLRIGLLAGANGQMTVDGAGSSLTVYGGVSVGGGVGGGDGSLSITNGGAVSVFTANGAGYLDVGGASTPATVRVDGAGSSLTIDAQLSIAGVAGDGDGSLSITNGGVVTVQGTYDAYVGEQAFGLATVDGTGSRWTIGGDLYVSLNGAGIVTVSDGGAIAADNIYLYDNSILNIGAGDISPADAAGTLETGQIVFRGDNSFLTFNHTDTDYDFSAVLVSEFAPGLLQHLAGTTHLTADSSDFMGQTLVTGGTLVIDGSLAGVAVVNGGGTLQVDGLYLGEVTTVGLDGTLAGAGQITGIVEVQAGGTLLGVQGQTLTMGQLTLDSLSTTDITLTAPGGTVLFDVVGDLFLDGQLVVNSPGAFGEGLYRVFDYGGELTDGGMDIVTVPGGTDPGDFSIQTAVAGQVNLVYGAGAPLTFNFWDPGTPADGEISGGSGTWNATDPNWTDESGSANGPPEPSGLMIFTGAPGTVTVDDSEGQVFVGGLQFAVDGYRVEGDSLILTQPLTAIRVGDGTADGIDYDAAIDSVLTGAGGLEKTDYGTLFLLSANTYTGGTTVTDGVLIGRADAFGSGDITNNAMLVIDAETPGVLANALHGAGLFAKSGSGVLTLTGVSDFSGDTEVRGGRLVVNGGLGVSTVTVRSGATLAGNGSVGGVNALAGSTIAPGNSIGTLNVMGNYAQASGSIYQAELAPNGTSDLINATGAATLAPGAGVQIVRTGPAASYVLGTRYTVLTAAGGVSGTYTVSGATNISAFIDLVADYDATHVYVDVDQTHAFVEAGLTPNQIAAGGGADSLGSGNGLFDAIVYLPTFDQARAAFDQISGEIHASVRGASLEDSRFVRDAALDRLSDAFGYEAPATAGWARAFGSWAEIDGDGNAAGLDRSIGGLLLGLDVAGGETWRLGVEAGYGRAEFEVDERASEASSDDYHLGVYGGGQWGPLGLRLGATHSWRQLEVERAVAFAGFSDRLSSDYEVKVAQVFGEFGYRFEFDRLRAEPFLGLAYVAVDAEGAAEKGGAAAIDLQGGNSSATVSTVGLRLGTGWTAGDRATMSLDGTIAWRHAWGDVTPTSTAAFAGGDRFTVSGAPIAEEALRLDLGLTWVTTDALSIGVSYSGELGDGVQDHGVSVTARWRF